eukprot:6114536-Prymnesium_polylepis.1
MGTVTPGMISTSSPPLPVSIGPLWAHVGTTAGTPALNGPGTPLDSVSGDALTGVGANRLLGRAAQ